MADTVLEALGFGFQFRPLGEWWEVMVGGKNYYYYYSIYLHLTSLNTLISLYERERERESKMSFCILERGRE